MQGSSVPPVWASWQPCCLWQWASGGWRGLDPVGCCQGPVQGWGGPDSQWSFADPAASLAGGLQVTLLWRATRLAAWHYPCPFQHSTRLSTPPCECLVAFLGDWGWVFADRFLESSGVAMLIASACNWEAHTGTHPPSFLSMFLRAATMLAKRGGVALSQVRLQTSGRLCACLRRTVYLPQHVTICAAGQAWSRWSTESGGSSSISTPDCCPPAAHCPQSDCSGATAGCIQAQHQLRGTQHRLLSCYCHKGGDIHLPGRGGWVCGGSRKLLQR